MGAIALRLVCVCVCVCVRVERERVCVCVCEKCSGMAARRDAEKTLIKETRVSSLFISKKLDRAYSRPVYCARAVFLQSQKVLFATVAFISIERVLRVLLAVLDHKPISGNLCV